MKNQGGGVEQDRRVTKEDRSILRLHRELFLVRTDMLYLERKIHEVQTQNVKLVLWHVLISVLFIVSVIFWMGLNK